jgi:hypothetical protein
MGARSVASAPDARGGKSWGISPDVKLDSTNVE